MDEPDVAAWAILTAGEDRQHGGNDGYDDADSLHYSWDSTVPNHAALRVGDVVVLWDKTTVRGVSVLDEVDLGVAEKSVYSCPACGLASFKERKTKLPRYLCFKCGATFSERRSEDKKVITYKGHYASSWVSLRGLLSAAEVRALCLSPRSQLSLRPLDWTRFLRAIERAGGSDRLSDLLTRLRLAGPD